MKIKSIRSCRNITDWPSYDLVFEWEDILSAELSLEIERVNSLNLKKNALARKVERLFRINPFRLIRLSNSPQFLFEMTTRYTSDDLNRKEVIPAIIDFHLSHNELGSFRNAYRYNPIVLISSKEVYELLQLNNFGDKFKHFPLSLPDKYKIGNKPFEKRWDLVLVGRQNTFLENCLTKYCEKHPDFLYVYRKDTDGNFPYLTNKGDVVGYIDNRQAYMELIRQSRIGFYATPGMDGGEKRTNGFNQVTPRFLELISGGCHIIARYPDNADTRFFQLSRFCESINTFEQFEAFMDYARNNEPDLSWYSKYLEDHYTSCRATQLQKLLSDI